MSKIRFDRLLKLAVIHANRARIEKLESAQAAAEVERKSLQTQLCNRVEENCCQADLLWSARTDRDNNAKQRDEIAEKLRASESDAERVRNLLLHLLKDHFWVNPDCHVNWGHDVFFSFYRDGHRDLNLRLLDFMRKYNLTSR